MSSFAVSHGWLHLFICGAVLVQRRCFLLLLI
jgi:hypothetical protein